MKNFKCWYLVERIGWLCFEMQFESKQKATNELFENICSKVCEVYLKIDKNYSLSSVVEAVVDMVMKHKKDLDDIDYMVVSDYILYGCEDDYLYDYEDYYK